MGLKPIIKVPNYFEGLNGHVLAPKNSSTCTIERAMCRDFSGIFEDTEEPERMRFTKHAYRSASYRALETGPNGLQKLEPSYQTRLHASPDACMSSVKLALSPFA